MKKIDWNERTRLVSPIDSDNYNSLSKNLIERWELTLYISQFFRRRLVIINNDEVFVPI
jgi:hypothetical protein